MYALFLLASCSTEPPAPALDPPSAPVGGPPVVLITLDTTRADRLGAYGHAEARTPNLDALAARGLRFARAVAPVPLTIPSHSTVMTGLLPPRHGVRDNGDYRLADDALTFAERLAANGFRTTAVVGAFVTQADWGFGQGFEHYDDDLGVPADRLSWRAERRAAEVVDGALEALGDDDPRRLFLWAHIFDAHAPYRAQEPFASQVPDPYDAELAYVDSELGRLLDALPADALVVVVGDHGESLGEWGEEQHGLLLAGGVLEVPLIVAGPGVAAGVFEAPVSLADVLPTVLGLLGIPVETGLDGRDVLTEGPPPAVFSETLYGYHHFGWSPLRAVTTATGRLVRGTRDEVEGEVDPSAVAWLDTVAEASPDWEAQPLTLDPAQVEQLQALGYLGAAGDPTALPADAVDPRDGIALVKQLGDLHSKPPAEQEAELRRILAVAPGMRDGRFRLARLLGQQGRFDEALSELVTAWELGPDSTNALMLGETWLQRGDPAEAIGWFDEARERDPRSLDALAGRVDCLVMLRRIDEARAEADLALLEGHDHGRLLLARAGLALAAGEPPGPWLEPMLHLAMTRPYTPRVLQMTAAVYRADGQPERAIDFLHRELMWRPVNVSARLDLYSLYSEHGRNVDAIKTIRPLLALQPDEPRWHALAARAYLAMGRPDLAAPEQAACAGIEGCPP